MSWVYAMYKEDDLLAVGTAKEICKKMGISIKTFHFYRTKHYKKLLENSKKRRYVIRIDKTEGEIEEYE